MIRVKKYKLENVSEKVLHYFIRPRLMNSFNLTKALMSLAFLKTLCLCKYVLNNFDACKDVCVYCNLACKSCKVLNI